MAKKKDGEKGNSKELDEAGEMATLQEYRKQIEDYWSFVAKELNSLGNAPK